MHVQERVIIPTQGYNSRTHLVSLPPMHPPPPPNTRAHTYTHRVIPDDSDSEEDAEDVLAALKAQFS